MLMGSARGWVRRSDDCGAAPILLNNRSELPLEKLVGALDRGALQRGTSGGGFSACVVVSVEIFFYLPFNLPFKCKEGTVMESMIASMACSM